MWLSSIPDEPDNVVRLAELISQCCAETLQIYSPKRFYILLADYVNVIDRLIRNLVVGKRLRDGDLETHCGRPIPVKAVVTAQHEVAPSPGATHHLDQLGGSLLRTGACCARYLLLQLDKEWLGR